MHIVLLILKIIGIILLVLFLLLLLVLFTVLCTPLSYQAGVMYYDNEGNVWLKLSIWFSALTAYATIAFTRSKLSINIRFLALGKVFINRTIKNDDEEAESSKTDPMSEEDESIDLEFVDLEPPAEDGKTINPDEISTIGSWEDISFDEPKKTVNYEKPKKTIEPVRSKKRIDPDKRSQEKQKKRTIKSVIRGIYEKLKGLYNKILSLLEKEKEMQDSLQKKKKALEWFLQQPSTQNVLSLIKKQGLKILKSIMPKKLTGELKLGVEDPELMGLICQFAGIFYPAYANHFSFTPIFGGKTLTGNCFLKGRIILGAILWHALPLIFTRDVHRVIRNSKKLLKKLG